MFPGLRYEVEYAMANADRSMAAYRMTAAHDGHEIDISGVMTVVIDDEGLIASRVDYWDSLTFLQQTGQA